MKLKILLASLAVTVSSCAATPEQLSAHCNTFGYTGSGHAQCMERTLAQDTARRQRALLGFTEGFHRQRPDPLDIYWAPQQAQSRATRCRPDGLGGFTCATY